MVFVPFLLCSFLKKGTQAEMSVIGVRSVPYVLHTEQRNTIIIGQGMTK
jgi:hypothetical protein